MYDVLICPLNKPPLYLKPRPKTIFAYYNIDIRLMYAQYTILYL
jgi:hypothetical protein